MTDQNLSAAAEKIVEQPSRSSVFAKVPPDTRRAATQTLLAVQRHNETLARRAAEE